MEKTQIPIIALAVFAIVMILAYGNIERIYAVTYVEKTVAHASDISNHIIAGSQMFSVIDEDNDAVITIRVSDGTILYTRDFTTVCETGATAGTCIPRAIRCDGDACYVLSSITIGTAKCRINKIVPTTGVVTTVWTNAVTGSCASALGYNGNLYIVRDNGGADVFSEVTTTGIESTLSSDLGVPTVYCLQAVTVNSIQYVAICTDASGASLKLWKLSSATVCNMAGAFTGLTATTDGTFVYLGLTTGDVKKVTSACAVSSTISPQGTGDVHGLIYHSPDTLYIYYESSITVSAYNITGSSEIAEYSCGNANAITNYLKTLAYSASLDVIGCDNYVNNKVRLIYQGNPPSAPTNNQDNGFCGNGTLRDCLGDHSALAGLLPANQNITTVATTIGQGIGIINPNDENPRTNGTGLFLMLITGTFFAVALMTTVHTLNMRGYISASVREIDPIFWLFLVVGVVSVAWYLDWIDDIIFFSMTVGLAGLIAFGVLKHFGRI